MKSLIRVVDTTTFLEKATATLVSIHDTRLQEQTEMAKMLFEDQPKYRIFGKNKTYEELFDSCKYSVSQYYKRQENICLMVIKAIGNGDELYLTIDDYEMVCA